MQWFTLDHPWVYSSSNSNQWNTLKAIPMTCKSIRSGHAKKISLKPDASHNNLIQSRNMWKPHKYGWLRSAIQYIVYSKLLAILWCRFAVLMFDYINADISLQNISYISDARPFSETLDGTIRHWKKHYATQHKKS